MPVLRGTCCSSDSSRLEGFQHWQGLGATFVDEESIGLDGEDTLNEAQIAEVSQRTPGFSLLRSLLIMLFDPVIDTVKTGPWVVFLMVVFFGLFGPPGVPYYWSIYCVVIVGFLFVTLFLVGACERYVVFVATILFTGIGVMGFLFSSILYLVVSDIFGEGSFKSVAIGLSPLVLISLAVAIATYGGSPPHNFVLAGNKVSIKVERREKYSAGFLAGILVLAGGGTINLIGSLNGGALGVLAGTSGCVALTFYYRHIIRDLRVLRIRERTMPTPYTFMRVDEIREARSRWWLGRLFKWMGSLRQSTGS